MKVSAVIPTRGDVDLSEILDSLPFDDIIVWDNSGRPQDLGVYGRYAAIAEAKHAHIYTQDDDCLVDAVAVVAAYEAGRLVANMPAGRWPDYPDSALVGWGAIFHRDLPTRAFDRFHLLDLDEEDWQFVYADDGCFSRECDGVFTALTPRTIIDVGFQHLPWAEDPARALFKQPGHAAKRARMLDLARRVRGDIDDDRRAT